MPKLSVNSKEIFSRARENFEEQNRVLVVFHNYYYVTNKGLTEECDKKENLEVTGAATASCLK